MAFDFNSKKFDENTTYVNPSLGDLGHPAHHAGATRAAGAAGHTFVRHGVRVDKLDVSDVYAETNHLYFDIWSVQAQKHIRFKAMINQFNESWSTSLDTDVYVGHAEPIKRVRTIERVINVGIDIPAAGVNEAFYNLSQIQLLVHCLHPLVEEYTGIQGIKQRHVKAGGDPLFKIRFKNLIFDGDRTSLTDVKNPRDTGMKGYIDNFQYVMDINAGFFNDRSNRHMLYPKLIKLSFTFYPFNEVTPAFVHTSDGKPPEFSDLFYPYGFGKNMTKEDEENHLLHNMRKAMHGTLPWGSVTPHTVFGDEFQLRLNIDTEGINRSFDAAPEASEGPKENVEEQPASDLLDEAARDQVKQTGVGGTNNKPNDFGFLPRSRYVPPRDGDQ